MVTVESFKKENPGLAHLEGDALWDAMEQYQMRLQLKEKALVKTLPFLQRYRLRYLFYYKMPNMVFCRNGYTGDKRCSSCKKGTGGPRLLMLDLTGTGESFSPCPHCSKKLVEEPNTNLNHRLWKTWKQLKKYFRAFVEWTHLVRFDISGRYEMFGDESHYVQSWEIGPKVSRYKLKPRKWWEHIFIERRSIRRTSW